MQIRLGGYNKFIAMERRKRKWRFFDIFLPLGCRVYHQLHIQFPLGYFHGLGAYRPQSSKRCTLFA